MGRKKQKVRWTSVDQEGFFPNDNEVSEVSFCYLKAITKVKRLIFCRTLLSTISFYNLFQQTGNKDFSFSNTSNTNLNPNYYNPSKRRDQNKRPKYRLSQEKDSTNPDDTPVTGCDSKDLQDFLRDCTTHEHSKTSKMDQTKSESINDGTSNSDLNESNANAKDCDTNSEHSSMMNGSTHSSYNNRYSMKL